MKFGAPFRSLGLVPIVESCVRFRKIWVEIQVRWAILRLEYSKEVREREGRWHGGVKMHQPVLSLYYIDVSA
jgi:hypothetical protein